MRCVALFLLRVTLAPALVLLVSLAQKRWGHTLGGRLVGLPLTTGPLLVLITLMSGTEATAIAAHGVVGGQISVVAYCATYAHLAGRVRWWQALPGAWAVALASVLVLQTVSSTWVATAVVLAAAAVALRTWPVWPGDARLTRIPARWETPARALTTGALVATLTGLAQVVGPRVAGLLATAPVIVSVLGPTTHRASGPAAAAALLRGTTMSISGTTMFSAVIASTIIGLGALPAFALGLLALVATDVALAQARARTVTRIPPAAPADDVAPSLAP